MRPFLLSTDASANAIGGVLEQLDSAGYKHPIGYFSRILSPTQRDYTVSERECLAIVEGIRHFKSFLSVGHFLVYVDHTALAALTKPKSRMAEGRLSRWQLFLQYFDFTVYPRPGSSHSVPDALSRITLLSISSTPTSTNATTTSSPSFLNRLKTAQASDLELFPLIYFSF